MRKATDEQILESYNRLKSCWLVAEELGMHGGTVWERLKRLGIKDKDKWTVEQLVLLNKAYSVGRDEPVNLKGLVGIIGKSKSSISRKARELGLTSRSRIRTAQEREIMGEMRKEWLKHHPHPRGAYKGGKAIRICPRCGIFFEVFPSSPQIYCGRICATNHIQSNSHQGYSKTGTRDDLSGQYFRSSWEANYARYLNYLIRTTDEVISWQFEPEIFEFKNIKSGPRFYTPDFKVYFEDGHFEYHEVKGWDYPNGQQARKQFAKYYPKLKLVLRDKAFFLSIKEQNLLIENWE